MAHPNSIDENQIETFLMAQKQRRYSSSFMHFLKRTKKRKGRAISDPAFVG
jgi:hypothetical protein